MRYEKLEKAEPALVAGAGTSVVGLLALLAFDFSTLQSVAVGLGMPTAQALLTRPAVYSPRSIEALGPDCDPVAAVPELLKAGNGFAHPDEPAATIGVLTLLGGFLVQLFAGVDFTSAFVSAAGIAGIQTAATRARVYSPETARNEATTSLAAAGAA